MLLIVNTTHKPWHSPSRHQYFTNSSLPAKLTRVISSSSSNNSYETNLHNQTRTNSSSISGKIKRLVLTPEGRTKLNIAPDRDFYAYPRLVTHVDDVFISNLTNLYREKLRSDWEILDLMSSWVSHLPKEVNYKRAVGHGLNAEELAKNARLDYFFVKDLNQEQQLQFEDCSFDAVLCTVSVQYLQQPEKIFEEVLRVLKPGGLFIVSFSNRMFYEKAVSAWREGSEYSRVQLVVQYFQCIEGFSQPEIIRKFGSEGGGHNSSTSIFDWVKRLMALVSVADPFYAVLAYKNPKLIYE